MGNDRDVGFRSSMNPFHDPWLVPLLHGGRQLGRRVPSTHGRMECVASLLSSHLAKDSFEGVNVLLSERNDTESPSTSNRTGAHANKHSGSKDSILPERGNLVRNVHLSL